AFADVSSDPVDPAKLLNIASIVTEKSLELARKQLMDDATAFPVLSVSDLQGIVKETLMGVDPKVAEAYIVYANDRDRARQARLVPDSSAISDYVHLTRYSRYRPDLGRREVYGETVLRSEEMHLKRYPHLQDHIIKSFGLAY